MVTSTFIETVFAPMTTWTNALRARLSLQSLAAKHVTKLFGEDVDRWRRLIHKPAPSAFCRDLVAYAHAAGTCTRAWHMYVQHKKAEGGDFPEDKAERMRKINELKREFDGLRPETKLDWECRALATRSAAAHRGSPLDSAVEAERELAQGSEISGGPWDLSYSLATDGDADATGLTTLWPLSESVVRSALQGHYY